MIVLFITVLSTCLPIGVMRIVILTAVTTPVSPLLVSLAMVAQDATRGVEFLNPYSMFSSPVDAAIDEKKVVIIDLSIILKPYRQLQLFGFLLVVDRSIKNWNLYFFHCCQSSNGLPVQVDLSEYELLSHFKHK